MSASSADVIRWGKERVRTGPWRGSGAVAYLAPLPDAPVPSADFVRRCLGVLAERGFTRAVTAALSPLEQGGFLAAGFEVEEELHLLAIELDDLRAQPAVPPLTRVRWSRRQEVLAIDQAAFSQFWQFDEHRLAEALRATPRTRFRAVVDPRDARTFVGYAITGRSGPRGFVQRLAVHPAAQRKGFGRGLLVDGLLWMRRRGVQRAVVNTQFDNDAALTLYQQIGFRRERSGLSVLSAGLT